MERVVGIEPTFPAWKAGVLPIYDTRILDNIIILNKNYIVNILYKVGYALLIASYLFRGSTQANDQIYSIIGLLLFYWLIWYISLPFDAKN